MNPFTRIAIGVVLAAAAWCPAARAQDTHVGWIASIDEHCDGKLRADDNAQPNPLHWKTDHFRFLYPGESVRCDGNGSMSIADPRRQDDEEYFQARWLVQDPQRRSDLREGKKQQVFGFRGGEAQPGSGGADRVGRPGGRQRGVRSAIFAPAEESTVRADKLVIRWNEITGATRITLSLTDKYHVPLWEQADVDTMAAQLISPEARLALTTYRDKGGANPFSLILTNGGTQQPAVHFSILSAEEERSLDKDLANCERKSGLWRSACRTYAFTHRGMWNAAAEEYEATLKLEPASRQLLLAALAAERSIGNTARVAELKANLPAGTQVPE